MKSFRSCQHLTKLLLNDQLSRAPLSQSGLGRRNYSVGKETFAVMYAEHGEPGKVLEGKILPLPDTVGPDEVYLKLLAAPVNPADINMIEGTYPVRPVLPTIVGNEGVGEVVEVGANVTTLRQGDWVLPDTPGWGTWREYAISPAKEFRKIPNDIPVASAAMLSVNPCTAYRMLTDFVDLQQGDTVVQNGANSAAGQAVIQIATARKINTINIVRNRPEIENLKTQLKDIGATHVVTEEFCRTPAMRELLKSVPTPRLALNCVGGKSSTELMRLLANQGVMVTYGGMSKQPITVPTGAMIFKEIKLFGYWMTEWTNRNKGNPLRDKMFDELCDLIRDCQMVPPPCQLTPLRDFQSAIAQSAQKFSGRKQLLQMNAISAD